MKIIQNSLLLLLLVTSFALARPMDSSEKEGPERGGPGELNELQKSEKTKESNKLSAVALGYPMDSSSSLTLLENNIDFKQLLTLETKTWRTSIKNGDRVYLQPNDETEANRDEFIENYTVGSEIFNQFLLIKTILADNKESNEDNDLDDSERTAAQVIRLTNVESNILTVLLNFAFFISNNEIELDIFRYL